VRALILAAGFGTRLHPLSQWCAKPAMPIRGLPVVAALLWLLERAGVDEVMLNVSHLPDTIRSAVDAWRPPAMRIEYSPEHEPLGTGGGIRRAADFLRDSDPCLVMAGDMLLDVDLASLLERHRVRDSRATLLLRRDPRAASFGTIGADDEGCVRRIADRFDLGGEQSAGVFLGARIFASRALDSLPDMERFEDLSDWLAPELAAGARDVHAELLTPEECIWEPVGTPTEYLDANLLPPPLSQLDWSECAARAGARVTPDLVLCRGAELGRGAVLERAVVWPGERVPEGLRESDGVFAHGAFHKCRLETADVSSGGGP